MASAREKTPQLGLWDDEVPKLSHDKMVIWAYENAESLVRQYLTAFPSRDYYAAISSKWESHAIKVPAGYKLEDLPPLPPKPTKLTGKKALEKVIEQYPESGNGRSLPRILGYADLVICWHSPYVEWDHAANKWEISGHTYSLLIEAKTALPTLGELMRQLNLYRLVFRDVALVVTEATHAEILREQGILVINYRDGVPL